MRLVVFFLLFTRTSRIYCDCKRVKRVLNGVAVQGRHTGYNAVRYFGAIGKEHGFPWFLADNVFGRGFTGDAFQLESLQGMLKCGGALVTPAIVQTACHCLSTWQKASSDSFRAPLVDNHWENVMVVYIGLNDEYIGHGNPTFWGSTPLLSTKFIVHNECAKFREGKELNIYDFGWVRVLDNWHPNPYFNVPLDGIDFAPIYAKDHLEQLYLDAARKRSVCLHLGFGVFQTSDPRWPSQVLRHGWGSIMDALACYKAVADNIPLGNITTHGTWICSTKFALHDQLLGKGDSGSPITCDNQYVAVASATTETKTTVIQEITGNRIVSEYTSILTPLFFASLQNAYEYRKVFEYFVANFEKGVSYADLVRIWYKKITTLAPGNRFRIFQDSPSLSSGFSLSFDVFPFVYLSLFISICLQ